MSESGENPIYKRFKFRIWDGKMWVQDFYLSHSGCLSFNSIFAQKEFTFQQFTGLFDKNGREIYEGDILEGPTPNFEHVHREMKANNYSFWERGVVTYYTELARFGISFYSEEGGEGYTGRDQHIDLYVKEGHVVIGNIFENKDLLR